jgi:salicylate hydroxylase
MASPTPKPLHIAICGGGIGGVALAIGLLPYSSTITFTIYEAASAFGEIGAGVGYGNNSHKAIQLISPALWERYKTRATFNGWDSKARTWFDFQVGEKGPDEGKSIIEVFMDNMETQSTVHRAHFLEELVSFLPEGVAVMGKRVVGLEQPAGEEGTVLISFADGTTATADAVVGCDGIRSACRAFVVGTDSPALRPRFTNKYAYRGLSPMDKALEVLGEEKARNRQMYLGHNGHILTFPVAKGNMLNIVAFHGTKTEDEEWEGEWVKPNQKEALTRDFADWGDRALAVLKV